MKLRAWWRARRDGPLTPDICEECKKPLRERERVEVLAGDIDYSSEFGGMSAVLVAYCKEHAP